MQMRRERCGYKKNRRYRMGGGSSLEGREEPLEKLEEATMARWRSLVAVDCCNEAWKTLQQQCLGGKRMVWGLDLEERN